ncbi:lipopolysaccharide biosynthesis protein [Tenacibaculum sp. 190524A05c]|uniref:lipopolysaccharide biosynthesis protein n=1 Tax=Tenacibaculum platacis TaxID=3137852 RepID=UPI0032B1A0CE
MFRGTIIAQVIAMIASIYIAKLYGEQAFGYLGLFISVSSILSIINTLQLDKCIVISKNVNEGKNWFNFLFLLITGIGFFNLGFFYIISDFFPNINRNILIISIINSIILSFNLVHESFFTFKKKFLTISNSKIFITLCNFSLQILLYSYLEFLGLIFSFLITQILISIYYFSRNKEYLDIISVPKIKSEISSNSSIIKYLFPSNLINALANYTMPILLLAFFSIEQAGVYFFSVKILGAPLHLISSSVSQVYFQESSELKKRQKSELLKLTKKVAKFNAVIMIAIVIAINTLGIHLLESYFKNQWMNLRVFLFILSFLIIARSTFNPISSLIIVLDKNKTGLLFNCYLLLINLIAIYYGNVFNNIIYTISILSFFGGIGYFILLFYFLNCLKKLDV